MLNKKERYYKKMTSSNNFIPTTKEEMKARGWDSLDIILISGDSYVDHPSFGTALIARYLEKYGFKVGIIDQPEWKNDEDICRLGTPNLFFAVSAGNLDSMVANRTSEKKPRKMDMYTPGNIPGKRPDRAVMVYCNLIKKNFPESMIVLGGIEASLRRIAYYDYWSNKLRRSILFDTRADILVYGMGEKAIVEIAQRVRHNAELIDIENTCLIYDEAPDDVALEISSYEEIVNDKKKLVESFVKYTKECCKKKPGKVIQKCQNKYLVIEPPYKATPDDLEEIFSLPFVRAQHPKYNEKVPAYGFVKDSVLSHRGCYGGCAFCTLSIHQGKHIVSRKEENIINEVNRVIVKDKEFKGNILDVGGPTANMYGSKCKNPEECSRLSCLVPSRCKFLEVDQKKHLNLLAKVANQPSVKKAFVSSGVRYDLAVECMEYVEGITADHISGQLSMAPEHTNDRVLKLMNKPSFSLYEKFIRKFDFLNKKNNKKQYVVPYFIAAYPGSTLNDMYDIAIYLRQNNMKVEQVQNFIPIPMTIASAMYYAEVDFINGKKVHVAKEDERLMQRALLQPTLKSNQNLLKKALKKIGKENEYDFLSGSKKTPTKKKKGQEYAKRKSF